MRRIIFCYNDNPGNSYIYIFWMKQLTNAQPLAYRLPNSEMVTSLAYIDDEIPELKSKVQYLIKSE